MDAALSEPDVEHGMTAVDLFDAVLGIGNAIQEMCKTMVCWYKYKSVDHDLFFLIDSENIFLFTKRSTTRKKSYVVYLVYTPFRT